MFTYDFESLYKQTAVGSEDWLPVPLDKMSVYDSRTNKQQQYRMCREFMGINLRLVEKFGRSSPFRESGARETLAEVVSQVSHHLWWWTNAQPDLIDCMMLNDMAEDERERFCDARRLWRVKQWHAQGSTPIPQSKPTHEFLAMFDDRDNQYCAWACREIGSRMCEMFADNLELLRQVKNEFESRSHIDTEIVEKVIARMNRPLVGCSEITDQCELGASRIGKVLNGMGFNKYRVSGRGDNQYIWVVADIDKYDKLHGAELRKAWEAMRAPEPEPEVSFL